MTTPGAPSLHEAEQRHLTDAEFHARVEQAVNTLRLTLHGRPEGALSDREKGLVLQAAAMGVLMAEFDLTPGGGVGAQRQFGQASAEEYRALAEIAEAVAKGSVHPQRIREVEKALERYTRDHDEDCDCGSCQVLAGTLKMTVTTPPRRSDA